ncbi:RHS repeat-associated core domain-containing protein [Halomonadaceae bacterium KBTZ08]
MSQSKPIELIADNGDAFAFAVSQADGAGDGIKQESLQGWRSWLHERFRFKFSEQAPDWENLLRRTGDRVPAQAPGMTFQRVARLLNDGTIQVRRGSRPATASAGQSQSAEGEPASQMRSQSAAGTGSGAGTGAGAGQAGSAPSPQGAAREDTGPTTDQMQCKGDPVAPVTGEEILILEDFSVAAPMPFHWRRRYRSRQTARDLGLGAGWFADCLRVIWQDEEATWALDHEARPIRFPLLSKGGIAWQAAAGLRLERKQDDRMMLTEPDGCVWIMTHGGGSTWRPTRVQNRMGHQWNLAYDDQLRLARIELSPHKRLAFIYEGGDRIQQIELHQDESRQVLARYNYDQTGNLITAGTGSGTERYGYNGHQIANRELPAGYHFLFHWDGESPEARCLRAHGEDGHYDFRFDYQPEQYLTRVTDALGNTQVFHYDERDRIVARQDPDGGVHQWAYDDEGRLTACRLPDGRTTQYVYDTRGQLVREHLPDGRDHRWYYNELGFCVAETLPDGRELRRRFDALGRLLWQARADGSQWYYHYDANGWLSETVSDTGETRRTGFDQEGHLLADEQQGALTRFAFDERGRVKGRLDQDRVTEYDYEGDQLGAIHQYPEQAPDQRRSRYYQYDHAGRLTHFTAATGEVHGFEYDGLARPNRYRRPDGKHVVYQYDPEQRLTSVIRPDGGQWSLSYDSKGQVIACQAPDGRNIRFSYDAAGDIIHREQDGDWVQHLKRDAGGRVVQQVSQGRDRDPVRKTFQYDAYGRRTRANAADRNLAWGYDAYGRVTHHQQDEHSVHYEYGPGQQLTGMELPDGTRINYRYDRQGRWQAVAVNGETRLTRDFDAQGREHHRQAGHNQQSQDWDRYDCLIQRRWQAQPDSEAATTRERHYHWDAESRLEGYSDNAEGERRFERDAQGQLIGEDERRFQYDDGGNRLPDDNAELERDRLVKTAHAERRYDDLGAETTVLGDTPEYRRFDAEGQLTELRRDGLRVQYGTDALNRRAWRKSTEGTTTYLWHNDVLLGEHRPDGTWQYYIRDPQTDAPLLTLINGTPYYYELDWRAMPIRLWSGQGGLVWQANADAWGNCDPDTLQGPIHQPIRLPGQFEDELTGLFNNRFRDYDPLTARYVTPDPIGINGGLNSYRYTSNPVDYVDPLGLDSKPVVTAQNAAKGDMAPISEAAPSMQDMSGLEKVLGSIGGAVSAVGSAIAEAALTSIGVAGSVIGAVVALAYRQPAVPKDSIPEAAKDAAQAAKLAYSDSRDNQFDEWEEVGFNDKGLDTEGLGLRNSLFEDSEDGYHAKLFKNESENSYMVAYRGTDELVDWKHNGLQAMGKSSSQYDRAMTLAERAEQASGHQGAELTFTGHSLGGGLASAASEVTDKKAVTFNAAGLNPNTVTEHLGVSELPPNDKIDAYFVKGDLLSALQDPFHGFGVKDARGNRKPLTDNQFRGPYSRHGMDAVVESMGIN